MANEDLLFKIGADGSQAKAEAARVRQSLVGEAQRVSAGFAAAGSSSGKAFATGLQQSSAQIQAGLVTSLKSAQREGDGLYNTITQLRIGLTQIGRGDVGGIPNLIKAYRQFTGVGNEARTTLQVLDTALVASGARAVRAGDLFDNFASNTRKALNGTGAEARALQGAFEALGISLTNASLRPQQEFARLVQLFGRSGKDSREATAALDLLGLAEGRAADGARTAGSAMSTLGQGLGVSAGAATAAGIAFGVVAVAVAAAVIAVIAFAEATRGVISTAKEVGTKSKEEFDEFKKRVESAGLSVTQLDRNLSQGIVKALDQVKGASDGLFVQLIRSSGPQLIVLLRDVAKVLAELAPLAESFGQFMAVNFAVASAAVRTFGQVAQLAQKDLLGFAAVASNPAFIGGLLAANFKAARAEVEGLAKALPTAQFKASGSGAAKEQTTELEKQIALAQTAAQRAKRLAEERIADAERLRDLEILDAENAAREQIAAEREVTQAKLTELEARRALLLTETEDKRKQEIELAKLEEERQQLLADNEKKLQEIRDRQAAAEQKALDRTRQAVAEAIRLRRDQLAVNEEIARSQAERDRLRVEELAITPGQERAAITERRDALLAELEAEQSLFRQRIEIERAENENSQQSAEARLAIDANLKALLEESEILHQNRLRAIRQQARAEEFQAAGFDQTQAATLAQFEEVMGRQLTLSEKLRVSLAATAAQLKAQLPSGAAVAARALQSVAAATADSISALVSGAGTLRQAAGAITKALLQPYIEYAKQKAVKAFIESAEHFAAQDYVGGAKWAAIGAAWAGLAGVLGGVGSAVSGSGSGATGASAGSATGTRQNENTIPTEERIRFREGNAQGFVVQITLKTDQAQQVKNIETAALTSFNQGGAVKQILDNHAGNIPIGG